MNIFDTNEHYDRVLLAAPQPEYFAQVRAYGRSLLNTLRPELLDAASILKNASEITVSMNSVTMSDNSLDTQENVAVAASLAQKELFVKTAIDLAGPFEDIETRVVDSDGHIGDIPKILKADQSIEVRVKSLQVYSVDGTQITITHSDDELLGTDLTVAQRYRVIGTDTHDGGNVLKIWDIDPTDVTRFCYSESFIPNLKYSSIKDQNRYRKNSWQSFMPKNGVGKHDFTEQRFQEVMNLLIQCSAENQL